MNEPHPDKRETATEASPGEAGLPRGEPEPILAGPQAAGKLFLVRYSEIGLKGGNRGYFEGRLARNIGETAHGLGIERVSRIRGRLLVWHSGERTSALAARLADTPGVRTFSAARLLGSASYEAIEAAALELVSERLRRTPRPRTFAVATERSFKAFPLRSMEVSARVGAAVLRLAPDLKVRLGEPDFTIGIEIGRERSFVFGEYLEGPGGLPVGSSGRVVLLLSGGIDSPVAGWLLQKRGCEVAPLYFHASPFTGDAAKKKVIDLAALLARRQPVLELRIAQLAGAQVLIRDHCRADLLVVLYRRMMVRVAERIAERIGALALATGESIGQVASQTLPNLAVIDEVARRPILRPLATYDKEETIRLAERLKTFEISVRPAEDSCRLFVPAHPATHASPDEVAREEAKLALDPLADEIAAKAELLRFHRGERSTTSH